ncbi:MAG: sulfatase-like hydrolase/transferase [bacterium]
MNRPSTTRRTFLKNSSLIAATVTAGGFIPRRAGAQPNEFPNIIWLIGDDVGPKEIGCYGHPTVRTPNIDGLASEGILFTRAFVTISSCSPSRSSLFTGKYPHSTGAENLHDPLPAEQKILPEILTQKGYYSGNVGKCHLGSAAESKFSRVLQNVEDWKTFLNERPKDRPFFLSVGFHDAHRTFDQGCVDPPHKPSDAIVPPYLPDTAQTRQEFGAMCDEICRMDGVIGEMMNALENEGILDNTLVLFFGDNGIPFPAQKQLYMTAGLKSLSSPAGQGKSQPDRYTMV